jgi:hypothetical protein
VSNGYDVTFIHAGSEFSLRFEAFSRMLPLPSGHRERGGALAYNHPSPTTKATTSLLTIPAPRLQGISLLEERYARWGSKFCMAMFLFRGQFHIDIQDIDVKSNNMAVLDIVQHCFL